MCGCMELLEEVAVATSRHIWAGKQLFVSCMYRYMCMYMCMCRY